MLLLTLEIHPFEVFLFFFQRHSKLNPLILSSEFERCLDCIGQNGPTIRRHVFAQSANFRSFAHRDLDWKIIQNCANTGSFFVGAVSRGVFFGSFCEIILNPGQKECL